MANRTKDPARRVGRTIIVRCSQEFKTRVEDAFNEGVTDPEGRKYESVSDWVRSLLEADMKRQKSRG